MGEEIEERYKQRLLREDFLEAKETVRDREAKFSASVTQSLQYGVIANAGAIATLIGFVGTAGKDLVHPQILAIVFVPFVLGLICSARAISIHVKSDQENLDEVISSFILAANAKDILLFNEMHTGYRALNAKINQWLLFSFVFLVIGLITAFAVFPFLSWRS